MKLSEVKEILDAEILTGEEYLERRVCSAFGSDLMSDVLAFVEDCTLLLTGLTNLQVIRTAEMVDLNAIVFVRGKKPSEEIINMAKQHDIILMRTEKILYTACGKLYEKGLKGANIFGEMIDEY